MRVCDVRVIPGDSGFLVLGEFAVLVDTGFAFTGARLCENVRSALDGRPLDGILLTHSHYDHALGSVYVKRAFPDAVVAAGGYAAKIFAKESARAVMRDLDRKAACGAEYEDLIDALSVDVTLADGDTIFGYRAVSLPGHTKCSVGFWNEEEKFLISSETLGVYDGKNVAPAFLVGVEVSLSSIARVAALRPEKMLIPHFGLIEGAQVREYLTQAKAGAEETVREMQKRSREDAIAWYVDRFYKGEIERSYPKDAMLLNTGIMADLIHREMGQNNEEV